jgi:hypothetical protein
MDDEEGDQTEGKKKKKEKEMVITSFSLISPFFTVFGNPFKSILG